MPLIDNSEEIKKHNSAVGAQVQLANVQSYLNDAINEHIIPTIGFAEYTALIAAKTYPPTNLQMRVIDLLQKAAVGFMIYNWADQGAVQISDAGIHVLKGPNSLPASDKKIMALKKQNIVSAYNALEMAVTFLESNLVAFPVYAASEERLENRSLLINTSKEFQDAGVEINSDARLYQKLRITQRDVEDTFIESTLSVAIKKALHDGILGASLTTIQKELLKKVRKAIAFYTIAEAIPVMAISIDATGIFQLNETVGGISGNVENRTAASEKSLADARYIFCAKADQQMDGIRKFLAVNKDDFAYLVPEDVDVNAAGGNVYFF